MVCLVRGWLSSNNIVLMRGEGATAVVDTGYATHSDQTVDLVSRCLGGRSLSAIANTHLHSDHCGGNAGLQGRFPDSRVLVPLGCLNLVREWTESSLSFAETGQVCERFSADAELHPGTEISLGGFVWKIFRSPGHDPDSVVLFEEEFGVLLSADSLWERGFGILFPELLGESAIEDAGRTLDLIESLRPSIVIPGHGLPFVDVDSALANARSRLRSFQANPLSHASHAARVLIKFHLLEHRRVNANSLVSRLSEMSLIREVHHRYFSSIEILNWIGSCIDQLIRSGSLLRDSVDIVDSSS